MATTSGRAKNSAERNESGDEEVRQLRQRGCGSERRVRGGVRRLVPQVEGVQQAGVECFLYLTNDSSGNITYTGVWSDSGTGNCNVALYESTHVVVGSAVSQGPQIGCVGFNQHETYAAGTKGQTGTAYTVAIWKNGNVVGASYTATYPFGSDQTAAPGGGIRDPTSAGERRRCRRLVALDPGFVGGGAVSAGSPDRRHWRRRRRSIRRLYGNRGHRQSWQLQLSIAIGPSEAASTTVDRVTEVKEFVLLDRSPLDR